MAERDASLYVINNLDIDNLVGIPRQVRGLSLSRFLLALDPNDQRMPELHIAMAMFYILRAIEEIRKSPILGDVVVTPESIRYFEYMEFKLISSRDQNGELPNPRLGLFGLGICALKMVFGPSDVSEAVELNGVEIPERLLDLGSWFRKIWAEKLKATKGLVSVGLDGPILLSGITDEADVRYLELKKGNKLQAKIRRLFGKRQEDGGGIALSPEFVDFVIKLLEWDPILKANPNSIRSLKSHRFMNSHPYVMEWL